MAPSSWRWLVDGLIPQGRVTILLEEDDRASAPRLSGD